MSPRTFVGVVIPLIFLYVALAIAIVRCLFNRGRVPTEILTWQTFWTGLPFDHVYQSLDGSFLARFLLLLLRLFSFVWFLVICVFSYVLNEGNSWFYFTIWNLELLTVYFGMSVIASLIGLSERNTQKTLQQSRVIVHLGNCVQLLHNVCGGTAFFVTVVNFVLLSPSPKFWNVSEHLVTTCMMVMEVFLNKIPVRWEHVIANLLWAALYIFFIIPVKMEGAIHSWPYDFLNLYSASCIIWYTILFVVNIIVYLVWYGLDRLVNKYIGDKRTSAVTASYQGVATRLATVAEESHVISTGNTSIDVP